MASRRIADDIGPNDVVTLGLERLQPRSRAQAEGSDRTSASVGGAARAGQNSKRELCATVAYECSQVLGARRRDNKPDVMQPSVTTLLHVTGGRMRARKRNGV